jgi:hypothetical protein
MGLANARHSTISFWFCLRIFFSRCDIEEKREHVIYMHNYIAFLWNYNKHFFIFSFFNPAERFVTHTHTHFGPRPPPPPTAAENDSLRISLEADLSLWKFIEKFGIYM